MADWIDIALMTKKQLKAMIGNRDLVRGLNQQQLVQLAMEMQEQFGDLGRTPLEKRLHPGVERPGTGRAPGYRGKIKGVPPGPGGQRLLFDDAPLRKALRGPKTVAQHIKEGSSQVKGQKALVYPLKMSKGSSRLGLKRPPTVYQESGAGPRWGRGRAPLSLPKGPKGLLKGGGKLALRGLGPLFAVGAGIGLARDLIGRGDERVHDEDTEMYRQFQSDELSQLMGMGQQRAGMEQQAGRMGQMASYYQAAEMGKQVAETEGRAMLAPLIAGRERELGTTAVRPEISLAQALARRGGL